MKKSIMIGAALLTVGAVQAAVIVDDSFDIPDYSVGTLEGQGPAISGMTGNWVNGNNAEVTATGLTYSDANYSGASGGSIYVPAAAGNDRQGRLLSSPYTDASTDTVYLSFLMQTGTDNTTGYRAFELHDGGFDDSANRKFQVGFQDGDFASGGTDYGFRLFNDNDNFRSSLDTNTGDATLFVAKFEFSDVNDGDKVTVWQNPTLTSGVDPTGGVSFDTFNMSFDRVTLAKYGSNDGTSWDEIRLGDTFTDVIPEPATFGLLAVFGGGMLFMRRRFKR